ncbi:MAG: GntR family transcriptional regulator [Actinomycetes bacterium]
MENSPLRVSVVAAPVREQVLTKLRQAIFNRTFAPGQRLVERQLCELTGVSRTTIREALRQLEAEGLVTMAAHRGPIVRQTSLEEAADLYAVRAVLEALAGQLFTQRASDAQVDALEEAVNRIERESEEGSPTALLAAKDHFYDVLLDGAGNETVLWVLDSLRARVTFLRATSLQRPGRSAESLNELRVLIDAIRRRDGDAAWAACAQHVDRARAVAQEVLREENASLTGTGDARF